MWWVISLVALILLAIEAMAVTFVVMVALNGYPSLPDAFAIIYLVCAFGLVPVLSLLDGRLAKKLSETSSLPLWLAGIPTVVVSAIVVPLLLVGLTAVLLLAFRMI